MTSDMLCEDQIFAAAFIYLQICTQLIKRELGEAVEEFGPSTTSTTSLSLENNASKHIPHHQAFPIGNHHSSIVSIIMFTHTQFNTQ